MEQTRQQIREMLGAHTHYTQMEHLRTHLRAEMEKDIKGRQNKFNADRVKTDADQEKRRADMKAFNEMMERREAERKACDEKMMA
jgi:type II secretory pathway component PulK